MLKGLKNLLLTAVMVVGATMVTSGTVALVAMMAALPDAPSELAPTVFYAGPVVVLLAIVVGFFFSAVTLTVALFTMPPAMGLMKLFKLPRPLFDIVGGAMAGFICAECAVGGLESIARAKGGDLGGGEMRFLLEVCALVAGGALGYVRHLVLVRPQAAPSIPSGWAVESPLA